MFHNLIYEGWFLYCYRTKGKAFALGHLEFEGEYLFNKNWSGEGYDRDGDVINELNNGNGTIREYNIS